MAALPPNSLLVRSRSLRTATTTKPASTAAAPPPPVAPHSSHIHTFLTNLRLLDLDSLPDWPEFDAQTFSVQKKRIQSVEWALYQLFCLWDPEEARTKLEPFFPPRDQVQSINLRSALLRCLEHAKKSGALGRDAVVRKTMLDDCKGERLEEVLAVFSSVVLKKLVAAAAEAEGEHPAIAQQLALEERGYAGEKADLLALALAHKASLSRTLREKDAARRKYQDLAELLDLKERNIARRREQLKAQKPLDATQHITDDVRLDTLRTVRNNWAGNEQWMETLLGGDTNARKDGVLSAPFDRVWRRVQSDRLSELEDEGKGLLEQLDGRVRAQKDSLQKWQDFRQQMFGSQGTARTVEAPKLENPGQGIDFGFGGHENLHLGQMSPRKPKLATKPHPEPTSSLLQDLKRELAGVNAVPVTSLRSLLGPRTRQPARPQAVAPVEEPIEPADDAISELGDLEVQPEAPPAVQKPPIQPTEEPLQTMLAGRSRPQDRSRSRPLSLRDTYSAGQGIPSASLSRHSSRTTSSSNSRGEPGSPSPTRRIQPVTRLEPDEPSSPEPTSPTTAMADQILASMDNASPSPVKKSRPRHTLSLAERTRLSMARMSRGGKAFADPFEEEEDVSAAAPPARPSIAQDTPPILEDDDDLAYDSLAARTRKSLAGYEASRQKAQLERRRSQRKSRMAPRPEGGQFPKVEEEGVAEPPSPSNNVDVDDMEAIFKSRPKLQNSPPLSPTRHWDE